MLTLESILRTHKQMDAFGEGKHRFGHGCDRKAKSPQPPPESEETKKEEP